MEQLNQKFLKFHEDRMKKMFTILALENILWQLDVSKTDDWNVKSKGEFIGRLDEHVRTKKT